MDWLKSMNNAMEYIENNLEHKIDYPRLAQTACCSTFHFSRMFSSLAGITLAEYIRRRRLTMAAFELQRTGARVIDIALKYGYDSADAFSRAFRRLHGITPQAARKRAELLKAYPRLSFHMTIKGDVEMDYRIEEIDVPLRFAVREEIVRTDEAFEIVPGLWNRAGRSGFLQQLVNMSWEEPQCKLEGLVGIFGDTPSLSEETLVLCMGCRYQGEIPPGMKELILAPQKYAVFPNDIVGAWKRLYTEWLPVSGYNLADGPCIENYLAPDAEITQELWVPICSC